MTRTTATAGLAVSAMLALLVGCTTGEDPSPTPTGMDPPTEPVRGVALSPQGFPTDLSLLPDFFAQAAALPNGGVLWNGAWRDDAVAGTDAGTPPGAAVLVSEQAVEYSFTPILVFGWRSGTDLHIGVPADPADDWGNAAAADSFVEMLGEFASTHRPPYVFLGNESDAYFDQDPDGYPNWVSVYERAYDAIHEASPATMVGPVFNYENLSGSGVLASMGDPVWEALDTHDLDRVDVVGLTLYPFFSVPTPDAIPDDYLAPLADRIGDTPVFVTETGWPAGKPGGLDAPWEASEDCQADFAVRLPGLLSDVEVDGVSWLFLYPLVASGGLEDVEWQVFSTVSLMDDDGGPRPVYDVWVGLDWSGI